MYLKESIFVSTPLSARGGLKRLGYSTKANAKRTFNPLLAGRGVETHRHVVDAVGNLKAFNPPLAGRGVET
ncbi:hypothetical protein [Nostoc sp.]|uniref:hypothetical protein n=1 Tax=Nostoc sp. TaxID=1180 RepID=UPI002FF56C44